METLTLNKKGQITIPALLRKRLGISGGSQVRLFLEPGKKTVHLTPTSSVKDAFGILPKPKTTRSIEEMNEGMETSVAKEGANHEKD